MADKYQALLQHFRAEGLGFRVQDVEFEYWYTTIIYATIVYCDATTIIRARGLGCRSRV